MVHLVDNPKMRLKEKAATISRGQMREIAKAVSQMIAVTVAEIPQKVLSLLAHYQVSIEGKADEKKIIEAVIDKISEEDQAFNNDLEKLILIAIPDLSPFTQYDNFGEGSSGGNFLEGAKTIGASTASGAAGGGIVGAALGAIGGIFGFANSKKQEKIEKQKASAMTFSSMLQYKTAKLGSKVSGQPTMTTIVIAIIALVGIIVTVVLVMKNKKAK